jgi:hypothetical protein
MTRHCKVATWYDLLEFLEVHRLRSVLSPS